MACISPDGKLSESGRRILAALERESTPEGVAQATALPLFRVRGALRELVAAGLVKEEGGRFSVVD
jgi:DNA-binding IclR family transcriptional regulator